MNRARIRTRRVANGSALVSALLLGVALPAAAGLLQGCSKSTADDKTSIGVASLLFIKRAHTQVDSSGAVTIDVAGGNGQVLDYDRYVPGGSLNVLSPARPSSAPSGRGARRSASRAA